MSDTAQKLGNILPDQIPEYFQDYYPLFAIFITKYFEFLETSADSAQYALQNIQLNRDIDTTATELINEFLNTYMPDVPSNTAADRKLVLKYFRDFYKLKGTEQSFKFFFRAFFGDTVEVIYPRNFMFSTSDGNWYTEQSIRVVANVGNPEDLSHTTITGQTSTATASVEKVIKVTGVGNDVYDIVLTPASVNSLVPFVSSELITGVVYDFTLNTSSNVSVTSISTVTTSPGIYLDYRSQVSADQRLQDSYYYQQFSYVIRSKTDRALWERYILEQLHPTGTLMFSEYHTNDIGVGISATSATVAKTTLVETTVKIPSVKSFLVVPAYTFDRTGDLQTGTSNTRVANGVDFNWNPTTSLGSISYTADYDYVGENLTFALQRVGDATPVTEVIRFNGPSFDKSLRYVNQDSQIISWRTDLNSSNVVGRYLAVSSALTAGTLLTSFSVSVQTDVSSVLLLITWMKNSQGNNAKRESGNAVVLSFSSAGVIIPQFDDETGLKYRRVALGRTLEYNNLIYIHSSNSVVGNINSGDFTSTTSSKIVFKPYNWERGQTYDRMAVLFTIPNTSIQTILTETFQSANITASGVIASWSGFTTTASVGYFGSSSGIQFNFSGYTFVGTPRFFVYNGPASTSRFITTVSSEVSQSIISFDYVVGNNYNGGDAPETGDDLVLQWTSGAATTWNTATTIWSGSNAWDTGTTTLAGKAVMVAHVPDKIYGIGGTLFVSDLTVSSVVSIVNSSNTTTGFTVVNIATNSVMSVMPGLPPMTTSILNSFAMSSILPLSYKFTLTGGKYRITRITGLGYTALFKSGDWFTTSNNIIANAYRIDGVENDNSAVLDVVEGMAPTDLTTTFTEGYLARGVPIYLRTPVSKQIRSTSVVVYSNPAVTTSITVRLIQVNSESGLDNYAIDRFKITSVPANTSITTINMSIAVSSNSTLNISDTDFFNITTIG